MGLENMNAHLANKDIPYIQFPKVLAINAMKEKFLTRFMNVLDVILIVKLAN